MAEVEIEPDTGVIEVVRYVVVDDFGTVVNPLLLAGQVYGGIAEGIGQLTVRADGEVGVAHGDTIYLTPDASKIHKFGADGNAQ